MKGIISSHSALTAYQRQTAVDSVSTPGAPVPREGAVSGTSMRAARVSISEEARALAAGEPGVDRAKVDRLRSALDSGSLKFDSQLIAQRIVDRAE
jgi:flagellar biosynthesis anti-sigma factor FlgM